MITVACPAVAQAESMPSNDEVMDATAVAVPGDYLQDTRGATAHPSDPMDCQATSDPTVWYRVTAPATGVLTLRSRGSINWEAGANIDTNMGVYTGSPDRLSFVACGIHTFDEYRGFWEEAEIDATAGEAYYVMAAIPPISEDILDYDGSPYSDFINHRLSTSMRPHMSVTIDTGAAARTGIATITGTVRCSFPTTVGVGATLTQENRWLTVTGGGSVSARLCDEDGEPWSLGVTASNGFKFTPGRAEGTADLYAFSEVRATTTQALRLRATR